MSTPKITGTTRSCRDCTKRQSDRCTLTDTRILDRDIVAPFCPLPDYPAQIIADQQATIMAMYDPHKWGFTLALITHAAMKVHQPVSAERMTSVMIPYRRGTEEANVCLSSDYITAITVPAYEITFRDREDTFKLYMDSNPPRLSIQSKVNPDWWEPCTIIM